MLVCCVAGFQFVCDDELCFVVVVVVVVVTSHCCSGFEFGLSSGDSSSRSLR